MESVMNEPMKQAMKKAAMLIGVIVIAHVVAAPTVPITILQTFPGGPHPTLGPKAGYGKPKNTTQQSLLKGPATPGPGNWNAAGGGAWRSLGATRGSGTR